MAPVAPASRATVMRTQRAARRRTATAASDAIAGSPHPTAPTTACSETEPGPAHPARPVQIASAARNAARIATGARGNRRCNAGPPRLTPTTDAATRNSAQGAMPTSRYVIEPSQHVTQSAANRSTRVRMGRSRPSTPRRLRRRYAQGERGEVQVQDQDQDQDQDQPGPGPGPGRGPGPGPGPGPQVQVHRSTGPGPQVQVHRSRSTGPGPQVQVHRSRSTGPGPRKPRPAVGWGLIPPVRPERSRVPSLSRDEAKSKDAARPRAWDGATRFGSARARACGGATSRR